MAANPGVGPFGGEALPRLRVVPTVLFGLLLVFAFGAALPLPRADAPAISLLLEAGATALIAAPGLACGAFIGIFAHPAVLFVLIPLTAAAAWWMSGDWLSAVLTLLLFIPVFVLRRVLMARLPQTEAVCRLAVCCGLICLPLAYLTFIRAWGTAWPGEMIELWMTSLTELLQTVEIPLGGATVTYTAEQAGAVAQLFVMLLPGLAGLSCTAMAWLGYALTLLLFRMHGLGRLLTPAMRRLTMSRMGAAVFLGAAVLSLFGRGASLALPEAAALNLILLLEPPLILIGASVLRDYFRRRESVGGIVLVLAILMLLACDLSIVLLVVAGIGVVRTLRRGRDDSPSIS